MYYVSALSDAAINYDMRRLSECGDFVEIDIFFYKFGWINRNLGINV